MFRNWIEIRAYMIDRQRELIRTAERAREPVEPRVRTPKNRQHLLRLLFRRERRR